MPKHSRKLTGLKRPHDRALEREAALLDAPELNERRQFGLESMLRIMLVCRSREEREVCGFRHYHGLKVNDVARRLNLPAGHVRDVLESVNARCRQIDGRNELKHRLRAELGTGPTDPGDVLRGKATPDQGEEG